MWSGGESQAEAQPSTSSSPPNNELVSENAGEVVEAKESSSSDDEYIRLRVITSDLTSEMHFRVKLATSLGRLKRSYCAKLGQQVEGLRFMFDGHRITDEDTPKSLNMENDDIIELYQIRNGGSGL